MKKAMKWMDENGLDFQFHDYRKAGLDGDLLKSWVTEFGLEKVLNKRGTTWQKLPDDIKDKTDENSAIKLMLENPAMIKRPVFNFEGMTYIGFSKKDQEIIENKLLK